jgi:regulator of protease activity HflC (stomatin/prohibitin superfamily)
MYREQIRGTISGWTVAVLLLAAYAAVIWLFIQEVGSPEPAAWPIVAYSLVFTVLSLLWAGFFVVNPNEARVLTLFGRYWGSVKRDGFHWANPFLVKRRLSLRVRNFESSKIKVNDHEGNPVEIAAVIVWRVIETAEACFEVDNYEHYVKVQSESAVRNLATQYPYDAYVEGHKSLRGNTAEVAEQLKAEVQERLAKAGVEVLEARINHLAYAPEIAAAMLQRQQAGAIIAARQRIVEGAVGMVEMALEMLSRREIVHLDNERKAAMVSNLLVVLCGDRNTQPVVNTGTLYQ